MAVVYRAYDLRLERPVAIKVLRQDYSESDGFRERFRQEAKAAANLSHPNIVTVHDFGLDASRLYIVMEYVPGTDLKTILKERGRLDIDEAISLIVQACAGIGYAHRAGLVHCDVKPHNMLVTPDQRLKVTDFGIARALSSIAPDEKHDVVWGSPLYFSPEQAAGQAPSPASDVYSLGVVLYEMLTGQLPFTATDPVELARLHRESVPVSPRRINLDIPPALDQIIMKVLSKEPSARYRTADQLGRVLLTFSQSASAFAANIPGQAAAPVSSKPSVTLTDPVSVTLPPEKTSTLAQDSSSEIDWGSIGLGMLALLAVGGLIPFWLYVYFTLNPPIR
ncbi:protein kinase domain [Longilinea arvoryzae]|uniref:non-specific serine/threonine protein kinase n=2 Tax=Longilinea arvoryzae TaxID=360412 RepID=A0A0S7BGD2_9CHLR|nr:protein kinase domain [Longilinea arvoryzae]